MDIQFQLFWDSLENFPVFFSIFINMEKCLRFV